MARRRISARQVLTTIVVALAAYSVTSAVKCTPKTKSPDVVAFDYPGTDIPTVTDVPTQVATDAPQTPEVTPATQTTGSLELSNDGTADSLPTQEGSSGTTGSTSTQGSTTDSSDTRTGSLPTQSSGEGSSGTKTDLTQGSSVEPPSTRNSTSTGKHATFGDVTSGSNKCVVGNPNEYVTTHDIDWIWDSRIGRTNVQLTDSSWSVPDSKNWIMDHIVKNKGSLNYCIRWDGKDKLSKADASKFEAMLNRQYKAWNEWLIGYDCWPYNDIKVKIVGWAARDASILGWSDDSLGKIYAGELDSDGVPQCPQNCNRMYDAGISGWTDTSACSTEPYDLYLQPKQGLEGGYGFDFGQVVNRENMMASLDSEQLTIVAHEIGHGFGLPDFYETADMPSTDFPACIMKAGSSMTVTPADGWMLRRVLENVKSRYGF